MSMAERSLITIDDLSNEEIEAVFSLADEMCSRSEDHLSLCRGKIMATLFFEPSTRTRMSFEAAMQRLGGGVISAVDVNSTSLSKGESIADMARVVGSYADIIVIRHPWEGAAKLVAQYAGIPVINAGDGSHEHPTQTLCDLYTLKKEKQQIKGLKIALCGDLKYGRTVRSLAYALARFGATILFRSGPGLEIPEHVVRKLIAEYGGELKRYEALNDVTEERLFPLDAIYITPSVPHQLAMMPDISIQIELKKGVDAFYVTRLQKERHVPTAEGEELKKDYPVVDKKLLKEKRFKGTIVMHPLPRVDELAHELDADPRSMYFKQAARGVPIRMALIALLLGVKEVDIAEEERQAFAQKVDYPVYNRPFGVKCQNRNCVTLHEKWYIKPEFKIVNRQPLTLRCVYCEQETYPQYIASSEWHDGTLECKRYHSSDSHWLLKIKPENLIIFDSAKEAQAQGFRPSKYVTKRA
jgi:aspartate carbamoyltransferase catalytic subunit